MSADADIPASLDLFGKTADDLQEDIEINANGISGTLKYVTGYTGFSGKTAERSGNYLALHCAAPAAPDATITVEIVGGHSGPVTLDPEDNVIVLRIESTTEQSIRVIATKEGCTPVTREYSLTGLTLTPAA